MLRCPGSHLTQRMRSHWVVHRLRTPEEVYVAHLDSVMVRSAAQSPTSRKSQVSKLRQIMASWGKVASIESGRSVARRTQAGSPLVFNGPPSCLCRNRNTAATNVAAAGE